jgi:hypothetical protein
MSTTYLECPDSNSDRLVATILRLRQEPEEDDDEDDEEDEEQDKEDVDEEDDDGYSE